MSAYFFGEAFFAFFVVFFAAFLVAFGFLAAFLVLFFAAFGIVSWMSSQRTWIDGLRSRGTEWWWCKHYASGCLGIHKCCFVYTQKVPLRYHVHHS